MNNRYTKEFLEYLVDCERTEEDKTWILQRGYPLHFKRFYSRKFQYMESIEEEDLIRGLISFIVELGPVPEGIISPTIGRIDHRKGYVAGNFRWQEFVENSRDGNKSKSLDSKGRKLENLSLRLDLWRVKYFENKRKYLKYLGRRLEATKGK